MKINDWVIQIEDWSIRWQGDFIAPDAIGKKHLAGNVYGHPKIENGT
jgi:hypothetical protein